VLPTVSVLIVKQCATVTTCTRTRWSDPAECVPAIRTKPQIVSRSVCLVVRPDLIDAREWYHQISGQA
jgi:hypothetical protein